MTQQELDALWGQKMAVATDAPVRIGRFLPSETPTLALAIADEWARRTGLPRHAEFLRWFDDSQDPKPIKPAADALDDLLRRYPPPDPRQARYFRYALEQDELARYFNSLRAYDQRLKEKDHFRDTYTPDIKGYIRLLCAQDPSLARFFLTATGCCQFPNRTANAIPISSAGPDRENRNWSSAWFSTT